MFFFMTLTYLCEMYLVTLDFIYPLVTPTDLLPLLKKSFFYFVSLF